MTTSNRDSGFSDAVAALVVIVPLVWFFASVGLGMLKDQMEGPGSREEEGATAGRSASKGRSPRFTPPPVAKPLAVRIHEGREAYNVNCASCHQPGAVGKVGFAPDIHNPDFLSIATDDFLRQTIREGRPGTAMAPWKHLTEDQVTGIIAYLRAEGGSAVKPVRLDPNRRVPGEPSEGEPLFAAYCGSCHGPKGEGYIAGGAGPGIGLPGFLKAASDDFIVHTLEVGRRGTPMKSFKGAGGWPTFPGTRSATSWPTCALLGSMQVWRRPARLLPIAWRIRCMASSSITSTARPVTSPRAQGWSGSLPVFATGIFWLWPRMTSSNKPSGREGRGRPW